MQISRQRIRNVFRRVVQQYGTSGLKKQLWDTEFSGERWKHLESTPGDFVYSYVEKYADGGSILDLGCGSGNTGAELDGPTYRSYTGVDVSEEAIVRARRRTEEQGRSQKNSYLLADVLTYEPLRRYDVILLRDSIYYIPWRRVGSVLKRYAHHLTPRGVIVVRMYDSAGKYLRIIRTIEQSFDVHEQCSDASGAIVIVFRPSGLRVPID